MWWILCKNFRESEVWSPRHWRSAYNPPTSSNIYVICTFLAKISAKCAVKCAYRAIFYFILNNTLFCLPNVEHSRCPNRKNKKKMVDDATLDESSEKRKKENWRKWVGWSETWLRFAKRHRCDPLTLFNGCTSIEKEMESLSGNRCCTLDNPTGFLHKTHSNEWTSGYNVDNAALFFFKV